MSKVPSVEQYPTVADNSHPRIAQRRNQVQEEKFFEALFEGAGTVEEFYGPHPFGRILK